MRTEKNLFRGIESAREMTDDLLLEAKELFLRTAFDRGDIHAHAKAKEEMDLIFESAVEKFVDYQGFLDFIENIAKVNYSS